MTSTLIKALPLTCTGHSRPVTHLSFSGFLDVGGNAKRYLMISACKDGNPMLRNGITGDWIGTFLGHKGAIWCSRITSDGSWAVTGSADFTANIWNAQTGQVAAVLPHKHIVRTCDFIPGASKNSVTTQHNLDGSPRIGNEEDLKVVTGGQDKVVRIWNIPENRIETEWIAGDSPIRSTLWISPSVVVTVTFEGVVTWWDISQETPGKINEMELKATTGQVERHGDCIIIAAGTTGFVIEAASGINPSNTLFLTGCGSDTWVRLHDYKTGELLGHHGPVHSIAYSPDGCIGATGSEDGTIRLWKMTPEPYGLWA